MRVPGPSRAELDRAGDAFADLVARDLRAALNAAARDLPRVAPTPDDLGALRRSWADRVERRLLPELRRAWAGAAGAQRGRLLGAAERADALVAAPVEIPAVRQELAEAYLADAANRLAGVGDRAWELAREQLAEGVRLGEGVGPLRDRMRATAGLARPRAEVVARTEVVGASNRGALEQMYAAGLPATKEWVATGDTRTRASHRAADGKRVDLKESFTVGGHPMDGPHDPRGPASETVSCRCTLVFDVVDDELSTETLVGEDAYAAVNRPEFTSVDTDAIGQYQSGGYRNLNQALRDGTVDDRQRAVIERLDALTNGSTTNADIEVMRGMSDASRFVGDVKVNDVFRDKAFLSTTTDRGTATHFARVNRDSAIWTITMPRGSRALKMPLANGEYELLLPRNVALKITSTSKRDVILDQDAYDYLLERAERRGWTPEEIRQRALDSGDMIEVYDIRATVT